MQEKSIEEFAVGNRGLGWVTVLFVMMGISITASTFTSWFSWGTEEGLIPQYYFVLSTLGFLFSYVYARKIWIWGRKFNLLTQPDFIQLRYECRPLTLFFAACSILIEAPWVIMEFASMGMVIQAVTHDAVGAKIGTVIVGIVVVSYILYSGMKSVAVTELVQGVISSAVIAIGFIFVVYRLWGGFGPLYQQVMEAAPDNLLISHGGDYTYEHWCSLIITGTLGIMAWASFFSRIYTSKSVTDVKRVSAWSAVICFIFSVMLYTVALGSTTIQSAVDAIGSQTSLFVVADLAFGPVFLGFCGIVVVAAGMSMVSVIMNSHGVIISENFIKPFYKKGELSSETRLKIARWSLLIYSVIGIGISLADLPALYNIAIIVNEGICQVVPVLVFGMYWKRSNKYGALAGFVAGLVVAISYAALSGSVTWNGGMVGLAVNIVIHVACGFIFPKDPHVDELFEVVKNYNAKEEALAAALKAKNKEAAAAKESME
ncbi:MAG: sodium:solute symporter family protein [Lachnospiraceae bacterium]|nr:sodium:solute symporter family protein [Lachnospiraceae bacterium]